METKTIFERIITGDIPSYRIAEDSDFFAFLDINPVQPGHTLVVPKVATDYIFDIDDVELAKMIIFAKKVARAIEKVIPCRKIAITVIGLEVNHAHIHLIPISKEGDLDFKQKQKLPDSEMQRLASEIAIRFDADN